MLLGVNALNHDASLSLLDGDRILFAAHSERYSRIKNDRRLNREIVEDLLRYGKPEQIIWADNPFLKTLRKLYSGERPLFDGVRSHLKEVGLGDIKIQTVGHHRAHAAMGYYTSGLDDAAVLVMDAIGEWDTTTVWNARGSNLNRVAGISYPHSFGLFYSAMTKALGLKPNEEEYILMGMAALGKPYHADEILKDLFESFDPPYLMLKQNLHKGVGDYLKDKDWEDYDIAASVQEIAERYVLSSAVYVKDQLRTDSLILSGGVALNCVANGKLRDEDMFKNIWVPPNPGDAGLSLGAVLAVTRKQAVFDHAYFGTDIGRDLDIGSVIQSLLDSGIVGVANGRAEWGPRALGNRSLLADPRGSDVKDRVNAIKKREEFRPFAPVILEEHAEKYFRNIRYNQRYMQWTNECLYPEQFPAIVHVDGTSRIQTVPNNNTSIRRILEAWYERTGCPMLLNTSLNIKGEPLVNTWDDALRFSKLNEVMVY